MRESFSIDRDIASAATLPSAVYHDPRIHAHQRETVFTHSWQWVGDSSQVRAPYRAKPFMLLEGCLDEPLVLTCDGEGTVRCLSNVCTHRGALVVEGEGRYRGGMRCRYHGRRFGIDGQFVSMPEFDDVEGFPTKQDCLPQLPLERWGPFLFTSLSPLTTFSKWIEPVRRRTEWLPLDQMAFDPETSHDYLIQANWALYVDNYLEEFHIPYVHPSLSEALDYSAYRTECFPWGSLQLGAAKKGEPAFDLPEDHPDYGDRVAAFYFWLFPNLMLNVYPWGISVNVVTPLAPDRTRVSFLSYVLDSSRRQEGVGKELHLVEMEDEEVVESTQAGVRSTLYDRGRYSPRREVGTHHFHRLLAEAMHPSRDS